MGLCCCNEIKFSAGKCQSRFPRNCNQKYWLRQAFEKVKGVFNVTGSRGTRAGKSRDNSQFMAGLRPSLTGDVTKCGYMTLLPEGCIHETEDDFVAPDYTYCKGAGSAQKSVRGKEL
jgi:hypothetical protein